MTGEPRRIDIARPSFGPEETAAVAAVLESGWITQGPRVAEFEQRFAAMHGVRHAIATTSCTTALHLALVTQDIGPGDEIIVPAFTWVATANAVRYVGATPVFVDVCPRTYNLDLDRVAEAITPRTAAIIPVHLFGLCVDVPALRELLPDRVRIIEDAACAAGAMLGDDCAGALGDVGCFSFHPRKSVTTGEGGMITTSDDALAERMRRLRNHGAAVSEEARHRGSRPWDLPDFDEVGFNYRMTDLQGAVGCVQLGRLESFIEQRATWAAWYHDALGDLPWMRLPQEPARGRHAWQAFVATVDPETAPLSRNALMAALHERGIATRPGTHAVPALGAYRETCDASRFPQALACEASTIALPLHNRMNGDDYRRVADALHAIAAAPAGAAP